GIRCLIVTGVQTCALPICSDRPPAGAAVWPVWLLAAATVFLAGFRAGLNVRASNTIDVGYSGVIGADRILHGQSPYGNFPQEDRSEERRVGKRVGLGGGGV